MGLGGGEVVVHYDTAIGLYEAGGQNILAGTALVGRQAEGHTEQLLQLIAHTEEGLGACIGVIGPQHGGLLEIGHGVDTGIREHIQENISVVELEGVEPRSLHLLQPLGRGKQMKLLHDLHLVHLHRDGFMFVKSNSRHGKLLLHIVQILPLNDTGNKKRPPCPKGHRGRENPWYHLSLPPQRPHGALSCPQRCIGRTRRCLPPQRASERCSGR